VNSSSSVCHSCIIINALLNGYDVRKAISPLYCPVLVLELWGRCTTAAMDSAAKNDHFEIVRFLW